MDVQLIQQHLLKRLSFLQLSCFYAIFKVLYSVLLIYMMSTSPITIAIQEVLTLNRMILSTIFFSKFFFPYKT